MKLALDYCVLLCSIVFMSNTIYVPVRMPKELVEAIDIRAVRENRKRSQVIVMVLGEVFGARSKNDDGRGPRGEQDRPIERTGNTESVPVLPKAEGTEKHVYPVQPVRHKLAGRRDAPAELLESGPEGGAWSPASKCGHGYQNRFVCRAHNGGC